MNYGVGAYTEGPWAVTGDRWAYTLGLGTFYKTSDITSTEKDYPSPQSQRTPLLTKIWQTQDATMPADTTQYGYAYWFRYTTWYPEVQTTGKNRPWYVMSRMTTSNPQTDLAKLGDRTLAIW